MLKPRIIPTLLLRKNRMVKGIQFTDYRDTGDPVYASKVYNSQFVDELIFLDILASNICSSFVRAPMIIEWSIFCLFK